MLAACICAGYLAAVGYLYLFQRSYVFHPGGTLAEPAALGLPGVEVISLRAGDGTSLTGWYRQAEPGKPTVLYFHGNAGNLSGRSDRFGQVLGSGFGLMALSYRGFPGSAGEPSEAGLFADGLEAFDWLAERTENIVLHGESLGSGVAAYVAAERSARALILESPYTAALDIARETYPWVPVSLLMRDPFVTREHIARVEEPVLILHGTADRVVPVAHGRRLFELANEPKEIAIFEEAEHHELWEAGLWPAVLQFLKANGVAAQAPAVRRMPSAAG